MTTPPASVPVRLGPRGYEVTIGSGVLAKLGDAVASLPHAPARAVIVRDAGVPDACVSATEASLARRSVRPLRWAMTPTEEAKSLDQFGALLSFLASERVERTEPLIALGGGIVGD